MGIPSNELKDFLINEIDPCLEVFLPEGEREYDRETIAKYYGVYSGLKMVLDWVIEREENNKDLELIEWIEKKQAGF